MNPYNEYRHIFYIELFPYISVPLSIIFNKNKYG